MTEIENLVRDYARRCPPITPAELTAHLERTRADDVSDVRILGEVDDSESPDQPGRRMGILLATVAATMLLIVGAVSVLDRNRDDAEPGVLIPTLDEAVPPGSMRWTRVPHDESVFGGRHDRWISDVTVGGPGLVAVGSEGTPNLYGSTAAAIWTSSDGANWSRVPHDEAIFGGLNDQRMNGVVAAGGALIAVGSTTFPYSQKAAAVWTSHDGVTWSRVPHDDAVFEGAGDVVMNEVIAGGPGLVAVGRDGSAAAVWTSTNGAAWSRVPHDDEIFGPRDGDGLGMTSVTVGGPGFVAVGSSVGDPHAVVWTSVDGLAWSRVPHDEAVFGGSGAVLMWSVTAGGPGLVAVGSKGPNAFYPGEGPLNAHAVVWTSVDGLAWSRVPHDATVFGDSEVGDRWMQSVTAGGPGLVAVGGPSRATRIDWDLGQGQEAAVEAAEAVVWTSDDGMVWERVVDQAGLGSDPYQWMQSVTAWGHGLVAVGSSRSGEVDAAIWVATIDE